MTKEEEELPSVVEVEYESKTKKLKFLSNLIEESKVNRIKALNFFSFAISEEHKVSSLQIDK